MRIILALAEFNSQSKVDKNQSHISKNPNLFWVIFSGDFIAFDRVNLIADFINAYQTPMNQMMSTKLL